MISHTAPPPTRPVHPVAALPLLGNRLCLDFTNTLVWRLRPQPSEFLTDYPALVAWSRHAASVDDLLAARLLGDADRRAHAAGATVERAIALREAIYCVFVATIEREPPTAADLAVLNEVLDTGMSRAKLTPSDGGFTWGW